MMHKFHLKMNWVKIDEVSKVEFFVENLRIQESQMRKILPCLIEIQIWG